VLVEEMSIVHEFPLKLSEEWTQQKSLKIAPRPYKHGSPRSVVAHWAYLEGHLVTNGVAVVAELLLMAVGEWAILAGPGWATAPTLDGGEWTSPV
jgi:hypothetical protein